MRNYARRHKRCSESPNLPSSAASPRQDPAAGPCPSRPLGSCTLLHGGSCRSCCKSFGFRQLSSCASVWTLTSPSAYSKKKIIISNRNDDEAVKARTSLRRGVSRSGGERVGGCRDQTPLVRGACAEVVLPLPEDPAGRCSFPGQKWHT